MDNDLAIFDVMASVRECAIARFYTDEITIILDETTTEPSSYTDGTMHVWIGRVVSDRDGAVIATWDIDAEDRMCTFTTK